PVNNACSGATQDTPHLGFGGRRIEDDDEASRGLRHSVGAQRSIQSRALGARYQQASHYDDYREFGRDRPWPPPPRASRWPARPCNRVSTSAWLFELAAQIAEGGGRARHRLAGDTGRMELTQPFDLTLAAHALFKVSLYKRKVLSGQRSVHEPRQQHVRDLVRGGIEWNHVPGHAPTFPPPAGSGLRRRRARNRGRRSSGNR